MSDAWAMALWNGFFGASATAVVALLVLFISIKVQKDGLTNQLEKLDGHHKEQLKKQDDALTSQLEAQRQENANGRINAALGQLLAALAATASGRQSRGLTVEEVNNCFVPMEQILLDLDEKDADKFGVVVREWLQHLCFAPRDKFQTDAHKKDDGISMSGQVSFLLDRITRWARADPKYRMTLMDDMDNALKIAKKGLIAWGAVYEED
ncbi:hypothetical protein [Pseudarthrobacter siccitolerans]